jgi:hypothetical protein
MDRAAQHSLDALQDSEGVEALRPATVEGEDSKKRGSFCFPHRKPENRLCRPRLPARSSLTTSAPSIRWRKERFTGRTLRKGGHRKGLNRVRGGPGRVVGLCPLDLQKMT